MINLVKLLVDYGIKILGMSVVDVNCVEDCDEFDKVIKVLVIL